MYLQPNDVGTIFQLGLNMGPQNAHVLGLAKSFTKKIDHTTKVEHDQDAVAVISLAWGLMEKLMPQEVINETKQHLRDLGLPVVFTGPVRWTGKKTEIGLNPTAKDRTTGCGRTNSEFFRLPVAMFVEKSKNREKPV